MRINFFFPVADQNQNSDTKTIVAALKSTYLICEFKLSNLDNNLQIGEDYIKHEIFEKNHNYATERGTTRT